MAKTIKRTVSDLDAQSIESFLNGDNSYNTYSEESYIDPVLGQEVLDVLTDFDTDHGTALMHTMEELNEANMIAQSIEHYINVRNLKIKMCNAFSKASKAKGYGIEAIDFWRSMEADDDNKKDKNDDKWYKNAWEAIKAFFKKIILAVINFIKTIGNFIKGALCKAQDLFYKKYAKDIKANIGRYDTKDNKEIKIKMKSAGDGKVWIKKPWEMLYGGSRASVAAFSKIHSMMVSGNGNASKEIVSTLNFVVEKYPKMKEQAGKWFPSAATVVNNLIYGKDKPSKNEISIVTLFQDQSVIDILSPAALTQMTFAYKTAQQANKNLNNCLKYADKMSRQDKKFESGDSKKGGKASVEAANEAKRFSQFTTTVLIQLYGECLSCRMKVFSAAKKLYKKGDYSDDTE